jgi:D-glycero-D-manno-heptose 1,7-bisphosphate phosphatase
VKRAIFLDRDGVLIRAPKVNNKPTSIKELREIMVFKGLHKILKSLQKNYILIMITNQPDVSRNKIKKKDVRKINEYLKYFFHLNDVYVCYHDNKDNCDCRKPKPGMILKSKKKWNIDLKKSFLIGDRHKDIMAGKKAGCINFFINYNYNEKMPSKNHCTYAKSPYSALKMIWNISKNEKN